MMDFGRRPTGNTQNVLPKTGQTTSYRPGDDGDYEKGWEDGDRFTDNGDGTITDNATNLMWPKDWTGLGGNNGNKLKWNGCIDYSEALDFAGYTDWRLPNAIESPSLMNFSLSNPAVGAPFTNVPSDFFYTSTTYIGDLAAAWVMHSWTGRVFASPKIYNRRLLCCRDA